MHGGLEIAKQGKSFLFKFVLYLSLHITMAEISTDLKVSYFNIKYCIVITHISAITHLE